MFFADSNTSWEFFGLIYFQEDFNEIKFSMMDLTTKYEF